jgi:glycosyltransferase involved in cell wall biosynthesis
MTNRMHIGFFTNTYRPTMSGVVRSISTFRQAFSDMGHNVFIFAQKSVKYVDDEPFIFRYPAVEMPFANTYAVPVPFSSSIDDVMPALKMDVIHSHHPFILGETAAKKAEMFGVPLVFTFHTRYDEYTHYVPFSKELTKQVVDRWVGNYLEKCHHIITPSESIHDLLRENGVEGDITTIPTGIDIARFRDADGQVIRDQNGWGEDIILMSVGRLAKEKNFDTLLEGAAPVLRAHDNVQLVIIGGGFEEKALQKLAVNLGVADQVTFTGVLPYEDIPAYLKAADIFCFASVTETQGLVTMEAMAAGLPIVAVDATGTSDAMTNGKEGFLTDNNGPALAEALEKMVSSPDLRRQFADAAGERVQWFDSKYQAGRMLEAYQRAIAAKAANQYIRVQDK